VTLDALGTVFVEAARRILLGHERVPFREDGDEQPGASVEIKLAESGANEAPPPPREEGIWMVPAADDLVDEPLPAFERSSFSWISRDYRLVHVTMDATRLQRNVVSMTPSMGSGGGRCPVVLWRTE